LGPCPECAVEVRGWGMLFSEMIGLGPFIGVNFR